MPSKIIHLFILLFCAVNHSANSEKNKSTFVPSREWQPVTKGQPIPSGLRIRHNFQTGLTEAKLLDEESNDSGDNESSSRAKSLTLHPDKSVRLSEDEPIVKNEIKYSDDMKISLEELKARLKKIKLLDNEIPQEINNEHEETDSQSRFENYATIKKEFQSLGMNVSTDTEILTKYFERFEVHRDAVTTEALASSVVEDVLQLLNNMEYLLHQIDNAQTFADMGGMAKIISPCFNATNDEIRAEALRLLGTAVQSNPKVQARALEHDFVQKILHILANNNRVNIQSRCLFALSALIRQYPAAQKAFVSHGGLEIFRKILEDGHLQTQSRVMKLVGDLVVERRDLDEIEDEMLRRQKSYEYVSTDFEKKLLINGYCKHLGNLMMKSFSNEAFGDSNIEDYDFLAVTLDSMLLLSPICKRDFRSDKYSLLAVVNEALRVLRSQHEGVRDGTSSEDDYSFSHLVSLLGRLKTQLNVLEESHEEL